MLTIDTFLCIIQWQVIGMADEADDDVSFIAQVLQGLMDLSDKFIRHTRLSRFGAQWFHQFL